MKKTVNKFLAVMVVFVLCLAPIQMSAGQAYVSDYETASPFDLLAGELMFPEYFGGAYIDGDGNAVLLMVNMPVAPPVLEGRDAAQRPISAHIEQMQTSEGVTVREVEFAYSDLWATIHLLNELIPPTPEDMAAANAGGWHLDVASNRVVVELVDFTEDAVSVFRETVLDMPLIVFTQSDGPVMMDVPKFECLKMIEFGETMIMPLNTSPLLGSRITVRRNGVPISGGGSIGYRATLNGVRGFITAAHITGGLRVGDEIFHGWVSGRLGVVASSAHVQLNGADAAFITLQSGIEIGNRVARREIHGSTTHLWRGQEIASVGATTPGYRVGHITATGQRGSFLHEGTGITVIIQNMIESTAPSQSGDSAGITICLIMDAAVGIHVAGNRENTLSWHSTVSEINRGIGAVAR